MFVIVQSNSQMPLILSLSKDTRQAQPFRVGFDELSLSGYWNMAERVFVFGGET
jgi:hypothetical protein